MTTNLHISISAEPIFYLGPYAITNSLLTTWLVMGFLIIFIIFFKHKLKHVTWKQKPGHLQGMVEFMIEAFLNLTTSTAGSYKKTRAFFPFVATFFLFIIMSNWSGLIPGVGVIGFQEPVEIEAVNREPHNDNSIVDTHEESIPKHTVFVPYLRAPTADINTTLALALFSIVTVQAMGVKYIGWGYFTKFFNFKSPILFVVGILEIFSELSRIISFAFRLFGNIFAGEVLLTVIAALVPVLAPIPFLGMEVFVGFIQALVFAMLTLVFINMATESHAEH